MRLIFVVLTILGPSLAFAANFKTDNAYSYLEPRTSVDEKVQPLTLSPIKMSAEDVEGILRGRWHIVAHCNGKPLPDRWYEFTKTPGSLKTFVMELVSTPRGFTSYKVERSPETGGIVKTPAFSSPPQLPIESNGWFSVYGATFRPVLVEESGETAFESIGVYAECGPGVRAKPIWVAIPTS